MNADVLIDLDLAAVWQWHCQRDAMVTMVVRPDPAVRQYGAVVVDAADRICHINGQPNTKTHLSGEDLMFACIQVLSPQVLDHIPPARVVSTTAETYPALIARDASVYGYRYTGYWMDVGVPERYRQVHWDLLDGVLDDQWVPRMPPGTRVIRDADALRQHQDGVTIMPPVVLGPDVELAPDVRVGPYAVLAASCRLEAGAEVRESVLWEQVWIGAGARVSRSILGTGVHIRAASTVCQATRCG